LARAGEPGDRYLTPSHPQRRWIWTCSAKVRCSNCSRPARTHIGEDTLARWLLNPAAPDAVHARHDAVNELRPRLDLREELAVLAEDARPVWTRVAGRVGEAPALLKGGWLRAARSCSPCWACRRRRLACRTPQPNRLGSDVRIRVHSSARFLLDRLPHQFLVPLRLRKRLETVVAAGGESAHELKLLSEVLVRLGARNFPLTRAGALRASLNAEGDPPSKRLPG